MSIISKREYLDQYLFGNEDLTDKEKILLIYIVMYGPILGDLGDVVELATNLWSGSIDSKDARKLLNSLSINGYITYYESEYLNRCYITATYADAITWDDIVEADK